jgi:dihydrofolate reductase
MRPINVLTFVSMDGVMQAPGGPEEDTSGGFEYGGWTVPYFDEFLGGVMGEQTTPPFDLLLGRKTYDIFAGYWPHQDPSEPFVTSLNSATKYVVSHGKPDLSWEGSQLITGDVVKQLKDLKQGDGPQIQVHGSADLIQTLLENDLVDEFWLKIFPVTLGKGKRLFGDGAIPAAFTATGTTTSPTGVIVTTLKRAGDVQTGSFGETTASAT